jgi:hypothetical protein
MSAAQLPPPPLGHTRSPPSRKPPSRPDRPAPSPPVDRGQSRPAVPKRRPPKRPSRPAPAPPVVRDGSDSSDDDGVASELIEAVPSSNKYRDETAFLKRPAEVDGLSVAQLACSLEHAGIYCGAGVTKEAMQCALKASMTGRADNATATEVFDEFANRASGDLGKQELSMVCATLGNLLDADGLEDLFAELDEDANGSVR